MPQPSRIQGSLYVLLLVASFVLATGPAIVFGVLLNKAWIFNCDASGYEPDRFLAFCRDKAFAGYEHAAYARGIEPAAIAAVKAADVVLLGNSRLQFAFSNHVLPAYFDAKKIRFYLFGFGYGESGVFAKQVIGQIDARPRVVIINADDFFDTPMSEAGIAAEDDDWKRDIEFYLKKRLQGIHTEVCSTVPWLCGDKQTLYRDRSTGVWESRNFPLDHVYDTSRISMKKNSVAKAVAVEADAKAMIAWLESRGACVVLTGVPSPDYDRDAARQMAERLGVRHVFPDVSDLTYFDESHLNRQSAERYAGAFVRDFEPVLKTCPSN